MPAAPAAVPAALVRHTMAEAADLVTETWLLALDSAAVVSLRIVRLAALDAGALAESQRMVAEKAAAALDLPALGLTGGLGLTPLTVARRSVAYCHGRVAANRRRLGRGARNPA